MLRRRGLFLAVSMAVLAALAIVFVPREDGWLSALQLRGSADKELRAQLKELSGEVGRWGDFASYNLLLVLGLWFGGRMMRSRYVQRLAVASLLCAVFSGATANVFRFTLGRPRPRVVEKEGVADGFYGPQMRWDYNAFPSGHTATAFGSAIPLAIGAPVIGVPALVLSGGVSWARMFGGQHHPTDVAVAIWIAVVFGLPLGLAVRRTRRIRTGEEMEEDGEQPQSNPTPIAEAAKPEGGLSEA